VDDTRALSLIEPWATLIALGAKRIETRSWPTRFRGPFLVHASRALPRQNIALCQREPIRGILAAAGYPTHAALPRGAIVGAARLVDCRLITPETEAPPLERDVDHFSPGRFAWYLTEPRRLAAPVPARGMLGFWRVPEPVARAVREQLGPWSSLR
jgi:hypothetical protein